MYLKFILLVLLVFSSVNLNSQRILEISEVESANDVINEYIDVFVDVSNSLNVDQVSSPSLIHQFQSFQELESKLSNENTYWVRLFVDIQNPELLPLGLRFHRQNQQVVAYYISDKLVHKKRTGFFVSGKANEEIIPLSNTLLLSMKGKTDIYIQFKNTYDELPYFHIDLVVLKEEIVKNNYRVIFDAFVFGMMCILLLYGAFLFFQNKEKLYIQYALYILFLSIWYFTCFDFGYKLIDNLPRKIYPYSDIPAMLAFIFYIQFGRAFVNTKQFLPKWDKALHFTTYIILGFSIFLPVFMLVTKLIIVGYLILSLFSLLLLIIFTLFIIRLFRSNIQFSNILALGSAFIIIGTLYYGIYATLSKEYLFIAQKVGTLLELIVFTYGISVRYRLVEQEKRTYQSNLIEQLEENTKLQEEVNRELEQKVQERTTEIAEINEELIQQKEEIETQRDEVVSTNEALEKQKGKLELTLENLKLLQSQLIQSEKMATVGILTAGIAHELNNPINFVSSSVKPLLRDMNDVFAIIKKYDEIVKSNKFDDAFSEVEELKGKMDFSYLLREIINLLEGIEDGSNRSSQIVKGLRSFSMLDDEKSQLYDIHEGIDSALILLNSKIKDRIKVRKDFGDLKEIECFPSKLNQVIINILTNSIQAIDGKGEIFIQTVNSDFGIKIFIKDNGQGMTPEVKKHIFDPFFTTKDVGKGTGLGLSISYGIIEQHNGNIDVISEPSIGTEFIISLPVTQSNPATH